MVESNRTTGELGFVEANCTAGESGLCEATAIEVGTSKIEVQALPGYCRTVLQVSGDDADDGVADFAAGLEVQQLLLVSARAGVRLVRHSQVGQHRRAPGARPELQFELQSVCVLGSPLPYWFELVQAGNVGLDQLYRGREIEAGPAGKGGSNKTSDS